MQGWWQLLPAQGTQLMIPNTSSRLNSPPGGVSLAAQGETSSSASAAAEPTSQAPIATINTAARQAMTRQSQRAQQNLFTQLKRRELGMGFSSARLHHLAAIDEWQKEMEQVDFFGDLEEIAQLANLFRECVNDPTQRLLTLNPYGPQSLPILYFIKKVPPIPAHITQIEVHSCHGLETIDFSRCDAEKLQSVKVISSGLTHWPDLKRFKQLKHLNLSNNLHMRGAGDVSHHPVLETLRLNYNQLLRRLSDLSKNPELVELSLDHTHFFASGSVVLSNPKLEKVSLRFCPQITQLPDFKACPALKVLDMVGSHYPNLPDDLHQYPHGATVNLSPGYPQLLPDSYADQLHKWPGRPKFLLGGTTV